jgi:hypothetical protein
MAAELAYAERVGLEIVRDAALDHCQIKMSLGPLDAFGDVGRTARSRGNDVGDGLDRGLDTARLWLRRQRKRGVMAAEQARVRVV